MRIICPLCSSKSLITGINIMNKEGTTKEIYCICKNSEACGASFIYTLMFKKFIHEPAHTPLEIARQLIKNLDQQQKDELKRHVAKQIGNDENP